MFVANRMAKNPVTVTPDTSLDDAALAMKKGHFRRLPVVENGRLVGFFSDKDLMRVSPSPATTLSRYEEKSLLARMKVADIMQKDVISVSEDATIDEAALNWGVKVLRYEIKDLTPPAVILQAMQQQITAEREKRAVVASSEGRKLEQINLATGAKEAAIAKSEGEKQAEINKAEGQAAATLAIATATAEALRRVAAATNEEGGMNAVNLQVAEKYVEAFAQLAKTGNTLIVPGNLGDMSTLISSAMKIVDGVKTQNPTLPPKA